MNGTGTTRKWKWNLRRYLVAGVLVWLPILATVWVVNAILHLMDLTLRVLPPAFRPEALVGFPLPGIGALFALLVLLLTGLLVTNLIGRRLVSSPAILPPRITRIRSDKSSTSGKSDEITSTAIPPAASLRIRR